MALGHPHWVLGFQDEVWWSRLAQPDLHTWTDAKPLCLIQREPDRHDPAPQVVAYYGVLRADTQDMAPPLCGRPSGQCSDDTVSWVADGTADC
jgi:hypothetical protein